MAPAPPNDAPASSAKERMLAKLRGIKASGGLTNQAPARRSSSSQGASAKVGGKAFPFPVDAKDHCETGASAYDDITCVLHLLAERLGKASAELQIYDPYYCDGAVVANLAARGFPSVYNCREDFYKVIEDGGVPEYDVLVTNPPYSADHMERMLRFCVASKKPWLCLVPNFMYTSDYYKEVLGSHTKPFFVTPAVRYEYHSPADVQGRREGKTSPFVSFWFVHLSAEHNAPVIKTLRRTSAASHGPIGTAGDPHDTGACGGGEGKGVARNVPLVVGNGATLSSKLSELPQRMRAMWDTTRKRLRKKQRAAMKRRGRKGARGGR